MATTASRDFNRMLTMNNPLLEPVLKMGGAGDPLPTLSRDDPPTGTAASNVAKKPCSWPRTVAPVPSGESPDGTGESPVLPANPFFKRALRKIVTGNRVIEDEKDLVLGLWTFSGALSFEL